LANFYKKKKKTSAILFTVVTWGRRLKKGPKSTEVAIVGVDHGLAA
jgi:hypothetical protein